MTQMRCTVPHGGKWLDNTRLGKQWGWISEFFQDEGKVLDDRQRKKFAEAGSQHRSSSSRQQEKPCHNYHIYLELRPEKLENTKNIYIQMTAHQRSAFTHKECDCGWESNYHLHFHIIQMFKVLL